MKPLSIGVSCGGTGGHIFPGLATALELRRRGHQVRLWLAGKSIEHISVSGWNGPVATVPVEGFGKGGAPGALFGLLRMARAVAICRRMMRGDRPDALLAMGSYSSVGPVLAARMLKLPVVLHESNVIPGRAVQWLARYADHVAIHFPDTRAHLAHHSIAVTGMPLRGEFVARADRAFAAEGPFTILVMGGSQGAHYLNDVASQAVTALHQSGRPLRVIHLAGFTDESMVRQRYAAAGIAAEVHGFLRDMQSAYHSADLAVCRSGAASCAELAAQGLPALLIPYPAAARDHQMANARALQAAGAADIIPQAELTVTRLAEYIERIERDTGRRAAMHEAGCRFATPHGTRNLADLVESAGCPHLQRPEF